MKQWIKLLSRWTIILSISAMMGAIVLGVILLTLFMALFGILFAINSFSTFSLSNFFLGTAGMWWTAGGIYFIYLLCQKLEDEVFSKMFKVMEREMKKRRLEGAERSE